MRVNLWILPVALELLLQAAGAQGTVVPALPDTIITRTVAPEASWFDQVLSIASALMTLSILVLTVALVPAAWSFRRSHKVIRHIFEKIYGDVMPLMRHASTVADNLDYITTSIRVDVQQVNQTVAAANRRIMAAVARAEGRMDELNALLTVVQEEAESAFVNTAATIRGVTAGAVTFAAGDGHRRRARRARKDLAEALDESFDDEEEIDGDDGIRAGDDRTEAPRVRPRV